VIPLPLVSHMQQLPILLGDDCCLAVQAGHPPYDLHPSVVMEAEAVFRSLKDAGFTPNSLGYHWMMIVQVWSLPLRQFLCSRMHE